MTKTVTRKPITQAMQLALWRRFGSVLCSVCEIRLHGGLFHWDHHLALVDDGAHEVENVRPVCFLCHRKKSAREHKNNAKAKRLAAAREAHERGEKKASRMTHPRLKKKFSGEVVPRNPATAET